MSIPHLGELAALATACCWTITPLAFESAGKRVGSLAVNLIRLIVALAFFALLGMLTRGQPVPVHASSHAWIWLSVSGIVGFNIGDLCLFRAFIVLGSRLAMLLMALVPPMTALVGFLVMGERLHGMDWVGMALTIGGVAWVILERSPNPEPTSAPTPRRSGVLLGLGGAVGQAVGLVLSKYGMGDLSPFAATEIRVLAGIVGFALIFTVIRWWPTVIAALSDRAAMARIGLGAIFGPFLGVSLSLLAVQHTRAGVAATIMALVPVLIIPPTILLGKERVSPRAIAGAVVAVAGAAVLFL